MKSNINKFSMILSLLIIVLMSSSFYSTAIVTGDQIKTLEENNDKLNHYYTFEDNFIAIFYDDNDLLISNTAGSIIESITLMTPNIVSFEIDSLFDISSILNSGKYSIAMYLFPTDYNSLILYDGEIKREYGWDAIADMLGKNSQTHHIFATGNTMQLLNVLDNDMIDIVYGSNQEKVDANHQFIYALWTMADILENKFGGKYKSLGNDIRMATLQYFGSNFNDLVATSVDNKYPMGEDSPSTIEMRKQSYFEKHPGGGEKIARDNNILDTELKRDKDPVTGEIVTDYVMDIFPSSSKLDSDFIIQDLNLDNTDFGMLPSTINSGIRGPVGGIIDSILPYLLLEAGDAVGLDYATVSALANTLNEIPSFIGLANDFTADGLRDILEKFKPLLPIAEDQMEYFDLLVDSLFLLRGDQADVESLVDTAISLVVPKDAEISGAPVDQLLKNLFDVKDVFNQMQEGDDIIELLLSYFNQNMLEDLIKQFVGDGSVFGMDITGAENTVLLISGIIGLITQLLVSGDVGDLINDYGPKLMNTLSTVLPQLGLSDELINVLMTSIGLILTATGVVEGPNLEELFIMLLDFLVGDQIDINSIKAQTGAILDAISTAIDKPPADVDDFIIRYIDPAFNLTGVDAVTSDFIKNILRDLSSFILALKNPDFSISGVADISKLVVTLLSHYGITNQSDIDIIDNITNMILGVVSFVDDPPNIGKIFSNIVDDLKTMLFDMIDSIIQIFINSNPLTLNNNLNVDRNSIVLGISEAIELVFRLIKSRDNSLESLLMTLLQGAVHIFALVTGNDLTVYIEMFKGIFGDILDIVDDPPTLQEMQEILISYVPDTISTSDYENMKMIVGFVFVIKEIFTGGYKSILSALSQWIAEKATELIDFLLNDLDDILGNKRWELAKFDVPIGIGGFSLFTIAIDIGLRPNFEVDGIKLTTLLLKILFEGESMFSGDNPPEEVLMEALSFLTISPVIEASFELKDFGSEENNLINFILETIGVNIMIEGHGSFELMIFSFENGVFNTENLFKIISWGFSFTITLNKTITLLDFLTGGAGGGLNDIAEYIGLDFIKIDIWLSLTMEIIKKAAIANKPETGTMTLTISLGFSISLDIDIYIAWLHLSGSFEVIFTLLQDLIAPSPMRKFLSFVLILRANIGFLFWDWNWSYTWSPKGFSPDDPYEFTALNPKDAVENGALGGDTDGDGLSDNYELGVYGLSPEKEDSDGDTLSDKYEIKTLGTDPSSMDTDLDGLDDNIEINLKTNPLQPDSDYDGINDYEEVVIYGTDPLTRDTDFDGLTDYYEIHHAWNLTGITPSVSSVIIGGKSYNDRTDPLNSDTDGDGLFDGDEGPRGIYYGDGNALGINLQDAIIFNEGYTHPLDNDTDDDSYYQLDDGTKAPGNQFLMNMNDYNEIHGIPVIMIDPLTGLPEPSRLIYTNPVNPDSDMDTAPSSGTSIGFLNSDGYELSRNPPTDPLDGDSDDDGLIDGLEGMISQDSNHTNGLNPDTDGDSMGDLQELLLGSDPRHPDTDRDGISDGDEYFIYHTSIFNDDSDFDGLSDSEELFFYHSNPLRVDSDIDGLSDYDEVWKYFSNPSDEDSDNDFLTDYEEIMIYYTDPFNEDTDGDGLLDGEEIEGLPYVQNGVTYIIKTDPLKWDTDNDSIVSENGDLIQSMNDYEEFMIKTDPTRSDTDLDGISDAWEIYLGTDKIPWLESIKLDPLSNDTDNDNLMDGQELIIANISTLIYPFVAFIPVYPFNSSPTNNDTDNDYLIDGYEIKLGTAADLNDTDGDNIDDYKELIIYKTDPRKSDTDGDGLNDYDELFGYNFPDNSSIIFTNAIDSDTDGDLLPDGAEVYFYHRDPNNADENNNEILDGMEIDSDGDRLFDGEEYYTYFTAQTPEGGGPFQPDSDRDGLFDGLEVYETSTSPALWDTDYDSYSDGLEIYCGTDPTDNSTTNDEIQSCFSDLAVLAVLSPVNRKSYSTNAIPLIVFDSTYNATEMSYKLKNINDADWSEPTNMVQRDQIGYWDGYTLDLPVKNGSYELEITAQINGELKTRTTTFKVEMIPVDTFNIISPEKDMVYSFNNLETPKLPIEIQLGLDFKEVKFRIRYDNGSLLRDNTSLILDTGRSNYFLPSFEFPDIRGTMTYTLEVFANNTRGIEIAQLVSFGIKIPSIVENTLVIGVSVGTITGITVIIKKKNSFKNPFKKGDIGGDI